jgi:hypothetical protein
VAPVLKKFAVGSDVDNAALVLNCAIYLNNFSRSVTY